MKLRFCNETLKAIESLEKLIKVDPKKNLNEQLVSNLMSFYDIQFPFPNQQKTSLAVSPSYSNALRTSAQSRQRTTSTLVHTFRNSSNSPWTSR